MPWAPDYVVDADLETFVRTETGDAYIPGYGSAASRAVDDACNRQFGQFATAQTLTYDTSNAAQLNNGRWLMLIDDVQDLTGITVTVAGIAVAAGVDGYQWWERNSAAFGVPYIGLTFRDRPAAGDLSVLAKFGWSAVPAAVPSAVRLQVNRWHVRRESPYGTAGAPSEGSEVRLSARLDPDVRAILSGAKIIRARMPR
jgi:hypothetical protein